jgi:sialic acid synthase SpsE
VTARLLPEIEIGRRIVGPGYPCYVIAEAGSNHNGDLALARELIDAAADAKCDAVKFQVFRPEELVTRTGPHAAYLDPLLADDESLFDLFSKTTMDRSWLPDLADHCRRRGIDFLATPFDIDAVDQLVAPEVAAPAIKNASSELWHLPLLSHAAATGLPLIISTGMADIEDVSDALAAVIDAGGSQAALLHCTVSYPTPPDALNLRAMATLRERFGVPVGLSDHSLGTWASVAAVAMGANVIEKHLSLDRTMEGPDQPFAVEPAELADMVAEIRDVERGLGDGVKRRQPSEEEVYRIGRRNVVATVDLESGHVIDASDVAALRSPLGISPRDLPKIVGGKLTRPVRAGQPLQWADLE